MTTEAKKRPINRLQSMYALRAQVDLMYKDTLEAEKEGRPTAWCMLEAFAPPLLEAIGMKGVFPENYGTVCAASGAAAPYLERAGAEGFPDHLCGYARNCFGYAATMAELGEIPPDAPQGGMPKPLFLLSSSNLCDARFKWFQALGKYLNVPVYTLDVPRPGLRESLMEGAYKRNVSYLVTQLREFVVFLERLLGKKMDWDKLMEMQKAAEEVNVAWYGVRDLGKARPGPMHARDLWSSMPSARSMDSKVAIDLYRKMYDEVKSRVDNKIAGINQEEKYRLAFCGLPPWHSLGFFDKLAERGWNFVIEAAYRPPRPIDLSMVSDPIERLVRYRYQGLKRQINCDFEPEEAARIKEEIKRTGYSNKLSGVLVRDYQCDGAVMHTLLSCRGTSAPLLSIQNELMEVWKVPSLILEGDIVDMSLFDPVDALRKAEAFEETMDYYKKVRKEAGMAW